MVLLLLSITFSCSLSKYSSPNTNSSGITSPTTMGRDRYKYLSPRYPFYDNPFLISSGAPTSMYIKSGNQIQPFTHY